MLTAEEQKFVNYWERERLRKKKFLKNFSIGLPLGVLIVVATLISLFSGWYEKADMELHRDNSVIVVILIAAIAIVVFIAIFAARHRWEQNEAQYQEFLSKKHSAG